MNFATSWNDWTTDCAARPVALSDRNGDVYLIVHHAVNRRVQDTIALSKPGGRKVSMSFAIGPTTAGAASPVYCVGVVPESMKPHTTASKLDFAALTAEVSNIDLSATYPVAMEAKEWLARIAAHMHLVYRMPLDRVHVLSHQEVHARGYGSYATACPGPDLQASLDWIVARAKQLVTPTPPKRQEDDVYLYLWNGIADPDPRARYVLIGSELANGHYITNKVAEASGYSGMVPAPGAPRSVNDAQLNATIEVAKRVRADYLASLPTGGGGGAIDPSPIVAAIEKLGAKLVAELPKVIDEYADGKKNS